MCLAVPVKVVSVEGSTGKVDVSGNLVKADFTLVGDVRPGDFVILHAGFAIQKYDPADAEETLRIFREIEEAEGAAERGE